MMAVQALDHVANKSRFGILKGGGIYVILPKSHICLISLHRLCNDHGLHRILF